MAAAFALFNWIRARSAFILLGSILVVLILILNAIQGLRFPSSCGSYGRDVCNVELTPYTIKAVGEAVAEKLPRR